MEQKEDWEYLIFNKTDIDGLNFLNYRTALRECDYDVCRVHDSDDLIDRPDTPAKKNTYLKARIGADSVRAYKASSEFHIHQLDTLLTQLKDEQEWIQYTIYRLYSITSRYGEKPGRVIIVFTPLLLLSYLAARVVPAPPIISGTSGLLLTVLPPIFSGLLVLTSSRYIGD
jgi:hypothetical protein